MLAGGESPGGRAGRGTPRPLIKFPLSPRLTPAWKCGRKPGIVAEPAAGGIVAVQRPVGNPRDASDVPPVVDNVQPAIARVATGPPPAIRSLAGDLAFNEASLREALHAQGMLTVGIPKTVDPLPSVPAPADVLRIVNDAHRPSIPTPAPVHRACTCGSSRPVVERLMASLWCRGAGCRTYKGHRGALVQMGMAVMAHHAATVVRLHAYRLSTRARTFRRRLRLRCRQVNQCHASIH